MSSCAHTSFPVSILFFCCLFLLFHGLHHPSAGDVALAKFQRRVPTPRCPRKTLVHDHFNHTREVPTACWRRVFPGLEGVSWCLPQPCPDLLGDLGSLLRCQLQHLYHRVLRPLDLTTSQLQHSRAGRTQMLRLPNPSTGNLSVGTIHLSTLWALTGTSPRRLCQQVSRRCLLI